VSLAFDKRTTATSSVLYIALALWCCFVAAPGIIAGSGAFGPFQLNGGPISGWFFALWFLGYLAQFGVFMWIMALVRQQNIIWWLVASLLPWAIDWTMPVNPLFAAVWIPLTLAFAAWILMATRGEESFKEHAVHAVGVVLSVDQPYMNVVINNVYIKRKVRLRIERSDGTPPYEGVLNGLFMIGDIPSPGDRLPLLVDPANPQRFQGETA